MRDAVWKHKCGIGIWNFENCCAGCDWSVVGRKVVKKGKRKGGAWWTEEDRKFAKEKKGAYRQKKCCEGKK